MSPNFDLLCCVLQVAVFLVAFVVLTGAWLGFWAVRKLVLTEDGSIDTGVAQFVKWSFRIVASSMILQVPLLTFCFIVRSILIYIHKNYSVDSLWPIQLALVKTWNHAFILFLANLVK